MLGWVVVGLGFWQKKTFFDPKRFHPNIIFDPAQKFKVLMEFDTQVPRLGLSVFLCFFFRLFMDVSRVIHKCLNYTGIELWHLSIINAINLDSYFFFVLWDTPYNPFCIYLDVKKLGHFDILAYYKSGTFNNSFCNLEGRILEATKINSPEN